MNTMGIKSSQTPRTMGLKSSKTPHTMGLKTYTVYKNGPAQSAHASESHVVDNQNVSEFEPIGQGVNPYKSIKNKSRLER